MAANMRASPSSDRGDNGNLKGRNKDGKDAAPVEGPLFPALMLSVSIPPSSNKKLLIFDLNGLLAHTFFLDQGINIPKSRSPDAVMGRKYVFKRPFCDEFLRFCFENFYVSIWSSSSRRNVDGAIKCVMGSFADKLLFVWERADCTNTGFKTLEKKDKPLFLKELRKVWDKDGNYGLPEGDRRRFSPFNTLLIDDTPYKALLNPPNTAIFPQPYKLDHVNDASLGPRGELRAFLEGLATANVDVPSYVGSRRFGQQPITAAHQHWSFYSQVVDHLRNNAI